MIDENIVHEVNIWKLRRKFTRAEGIIFKNRVFFYDNLVYYYGKPGWNFEGEDFRVVISDDFLEGLETIQSHPNATISELLSEFQQQFHMSPPQQPILLLPQHIKILFFNTGSFRKMRIALVISFWIIAIGMMLFSILLIFHGILFLPIVACCIAIALLFLSFMLI